MKNIILLTAALLAATTAHAQTTTGTATANISSDLSITQVRALSFGTFSAGSTAGTITNGGIDPVVTTGGVTSVIPGEDGVFNLTGTPGASGTVTGVPTTASAIPTRYNRQPDVYIHRRGRCRVNHGTINPQTSATIPAQK